MVLSLYQFFTVSQENYWTAKCKTCGAQFQRWGKKRKSFYTRNMTTHLRRCHRYDSVRKEYQEAKCNENICTQTVAGSDAHGALAYLNQIQYLWSVMALNGEKSSVPQKLLKRNKRVRPGEEEMEENDKKQPGPSTTHNKEEANGLWTVTCGDKTGLLDKSRLSKSIECIECEGQWFVPPAFEEFGGKRSSKKWKASIFYKDKPLQYWFEQGYLSTKGFHKRSTDCLKETTNLPSDFISEHLSDSNSATTTVNNSPAEPPGEPDSSLSKDSWCQPLDADMLIEEDCPLTNDASSPAVESPTSSGLDVAGEVELTKSPKREDAEMIEIQCITGSEPSAPATTAPDVPEVIAAIKSQGTQTTQIENTDLKQTISEKSTASDSGVPESPPASSPSPSPSCDLDPMDLHQLKREKLKMQIKVLRLQEEYYVRKLGGLLT